MAKGRLDLKYIFVEKKEWFINMGCPSENALKRCKEAGKMSLEGEKFDLYDD